jgi:hypothetical protein
VQVEASCERAVFAHRFTQAGLHTLTARLGGDTVQLGVLDVRAPLNPNATATDPPSEKLVICASDFKSPITAKGSSSTSYALASDSSQLFDSALWSDGPELALNWLFPLSYNPPIEPFTLEMKALFGLCGRCAPEPSASARAPCTATCRRRPAATNATGEVLPLPVFPYRRVEIQGRAEG